MVLRVTVRVVLTGPFSDGRLRFGLLMSSLRRTRLDFLARRLVHAALTIIAASLVLWLLTAVAPGDPAQQVLAARGIDDPTHSQLAAVRRSLGLDSGVLVRYWHWLIGVLHGSFGVSYISGRGVSSELASHLVATLKLAGAAFGLVVVFAVVLATIGGMFAGRFARTWP